MSCTTSYSGDQTLPMDIDDDESIQLPSPPRIRRQRRTQSEQLLMMEQPADSRAWSMVSPLRLQRQRRTQSEQLADSRTRSQSMELFIVPYQP